MDQHDLNGMANDVRSLYSHEKQDTLGEAKCLSDCCATVENTGFENPTLKPNHEINSCKSETLPEMERKCPNYDCDSSSNFTNGDANNLKKQSPVVPTSRSLIVEVGMHKIVNCDEGSSEAMSCSNRLASSAGQNKLAGEGNPKDGEVSAHSLERTDSMQHISIKSDVSSETGERLNKEKSDLDVRRTKENRLNASEDGLKSIMQATFHEKQLKTESSSSNSTYVIFPASSNDSCQETSQDAKSCKNSRSSGMNGFICTGFKCSLEEPAVKGIVLGMAAQIAPKSVLESSVLPGRQGIVGKASEIVANVSTRDSEKVLGMIANQNSLIVKKIDLPKSSLTKKKNAELLDQDKEELSYELDDALEVAWRVAREVEQEVGIYREASGSSSSLERNGERVHLSSVDSADPTEKNCSTETGHRIKSRKELGKSDSLCSTKEVVDPGTSMKKEQLCLEEKEPSQNWGPTIMHEANNGLHGQESSSLTTKPEDVAANDQNPRLFRFDLNEDILENEVEYPKESVNETLSSYHVVNVSTPIPVVAKSGVPTRLPITPLQFEGERGWKGSAATSAFRPASLSKSSSRNNASSTNDITYSSKHLQGIKGIDLNVAAAGDDFDMEMFPEKYVSVPSGFPSGESSVEVSSKRAERLSFDLNCLSENDDNCPQSCPRASLSTHSIGDFDLNDNPSFGDACNDAHWPDQRAQPLRNRAYDPVVTFVGNARQPESNCVRPGYWADLSCVRGFSHGHAQPFLVAAPNVLPQVEQMQRVIPPQPKLTYAPPLPPHAFPYNNGFCIGPTNLLSSTIYSPGALPYLTDPRGTTVVPQILGSGTLSAFPGTPHLMEFAGGPSPSDIAIRPRFDLNGGVSSSENGSRGGNARQLFIPVSNSLMEEQMKSFQQGALPATPMKRREPEGGWDSSQLGRRQVTSWR